MNEIVPIFLNVPDDEMYNEVLKILLKTTKSRHGFFAYIDENGAMVAPSMTKDIWKECQIPGKTYIFPREAWGGTWGRALIEKRPVMSNAGHHPPQGHIHIERSICVPLIHVGEVVGLFAVANRGYDYAEQDLEQVKAMASFVAPVLHARLTRDRSERERQRAEKALWQAHRKLHLMSTLTRHDALNQLTVALGYAETAKAMQPEGDLAKYLDRIITSCKAILGQLEFMKTYQAIGTTSPEWQNARGVFDRAMASLDLGHVKVRNELSDFELYSDMMLERILYNLAENSLRHGEKVTAITASEVESDGGLTIVYEDDGVGIPDNEKEIIFDRGYGKHTGYGLYIAREILELTNIAIRERGIFGKGARFEILVPKGGYRRP
ncbi:MAG: HAMP domain-containing histidine kinase [Thermoplasmata archaeon]|jgi:signal transduction histidine kinase|nr:HAMP domain-containing histidine kinase [Thermoplasmata archaeon]